MAYKCKECLDKTCSILNKKLGDCEITEETIEGTRVVWRCLNYIKEDD
jgi:hypothetical protein